MQYVERSIDSQDWVTLLFVGCFVVLAILSVRYRKRFEDFIKLPISNNFFIAKGKTDAIKHPFNILLFYLQIVSISLFVLLFFSKESKLDSVLFFQVFIGVFVFVVIKLYIEKMIGTIFSIEVIINSYLYKKLTFTNYLSFFIFIANLFFYFSLKPSLNTLLVFTTVCLLFYSFIIYYSIKKYRTLLFSNFFYFILYLCALEISPYIILYKAVV